MPTDTATAQGATAAAEEPGMMEKAEAFLGRIEFLEMLEQKTHVQKIYIAAGVTLVLTIVILYGFGAGILCNLVGFVFPAYQSFKALEAESDRDERVWLTYWVVYSCFTIVEGFLEWFLFWVPFYYPIKLCVLIFLFHPQTLGSMQVYERVLKPALQPYVGKIDSMGRDMFDKVASAQTNIAGVASGMVGKEEIKK